MQEIAKSLKQLNNFLILVHVNPDGDAIGSGMALKRILEKMGKKAVFAVDGNLPRKLNFLQEYSEIGKAEDILSRDFECTIAVDVADKERLGAYLGKFMESEVRINIDHHATNSMFGTLNHVENVGAAGILVYELARLLGVEIDMETATLLYVAICTDTGNFSYGNADSRVLRTASELVGYGIDIPRIIKTIYKERTIQELKLLGVAIDHTRLFSDGRIGVSYIRIEDFERCSITIDDTEELIDFIRDIYGVEIAMILKESEEGKFRISFRSNSYADVAGLAALFEGGGHSRASGGRIEGELEDAIQRLVEKAEKFI